MIDKMRSGLIHFRVHSLKIQLFVRDENLSTDVRALAVVGDVEI